MCSESTRGADIRGWAERAAPQKRQGGTYILTGFRAISLVPTTGPATHTNAVNACAPDAIPAQSTHVHRTPRTVPATHKAHVLTAWPAWLSARIHGAEHAMCDHTLYQTTVITAICSTQHTTHGYDSGSKSSSSEAVYASKYSHEPHHQQR